ncbi:MAG: PilZ domain-containing protein [Idiomarina sp.]|nr:PilZ domain-containing protein [Idiomarinaceae bacterium]MBL4742536.1 PilZ domain-containing protein [Idiomarina sp.]PHQ76397.1 MAG: PilZ domain-containing protein [Idiomarina sp.]HAD48009.1 PilZ domain-containing protein [Idiomarina sp.]
MLNNDENRDFMRMSVNAEAKVIVGYDEGGDHEQVLDAICLDLSATGASLHLQSPVEQGESIVIYIKAGKVPAFKAKAEVVRSQRLEEGGYQLGCMITELL